MENVKMDTLEWIDVILIAIFPLLGIILYFVYKNNGELERADASLWGMLIALVIFIPLSFVLGLLGTILAIIIIFVMFSLNKEGKLPFAPQTVSSPGSEKLDEAHATPNNCPNCGASLSGQEIDWIDNITMRCPFCDSSVSV